MNPKLIVLILASSAVLWTDALGQDSLVTYTWSSSNGDSVATINLPPGFEVSSNWEYGEGIVTTLSWTDSSEVILQMGGNLHLPLLDSRDLLIQDSTQSRLGTSKRGKHVGRNLYWREDSIYSSWYNVAYDAIPANRVSIFDRAFSTFKPNTIPHIVR